MLRPPTEDVRVIRASPGWSNEGLHGFADRARVVKDHAGGSVLRGDLGGDEVFVKVAPVGGAKRRLQRVLGTTPLRRAWRGAAWLAEHGFETADPIALVEGRHQSEFVECFVARAVSGKTLLGHLVDGAADDACAQTIGADIGRMYTLGRWNRDHKASNLVVREDGRVAVVDTGDLRKIPTGFEAIERSLAAIMIEAVGVGAPVPEGFIGTAAVSAASAILGPEARVSAEELGERLATGARRRFDRHRDPAPEHDPLAHEREG